MMNQQQQQPPPPGPQYQLEQGQGEGVYVQPPPVYGYPPGVQRPVAKKFEPTEILNIVLRIVALATTFLATVLTGVAREEHTSGTRNLSSISPIKYFVAANSMVLIYSFATLVISIFSILTKNQNQQQGSTETLRQKFIMLFVIGDLVAVVFLFSAVGSSAGTKVYSNSESDFGEENFCDASSYGSYYSYSYSSSYFSDYHFGRTVLCAQWVAGIVLSMIGSIAYFVLQLLSVLTHAKVKSGRS